MLMCPIFARHHATVVTSFKASPPSPGLGRTNGGVKRMRLLVEKSGQRKKNKRATMCRHAPSSRRRD
ncbi:hypothetical protein HanXRQr2_Chr03g0096221 [Helianthus annuus]|uniref:Uncharacterized protein n=1 Tax=Helianthus annuus TaxID=4232 RepID=A0A9K3JCV2_HELAN|nr:hypothetical protein HanXRQr2_Chr03g0096221 [Helianthus annuus]